MTWQRSQDARQHARAHLHDLHTVGDRASAALARLVGSWRFVLGQNWFVAVWIAWNTIPGFPHFDPPPYIGLNLLFSWQASNTGPVLQMTGNHQAEIDRARDDHEAAEVDALFTMNERQLEILQLLRTLVKESEVADGNG